MTSMERARVLMLALASLALVSSGSPQEVAPAAVAERIDEAPAPRTAETIAAKLGQLNPELTESELSRISSAVVRYSEKYSLDPALVTAVIEVESGARPWVRSPKGALGLMQVMPYMMRPMHMAGNPSTIETNIEAGCMILAGNIRRLGEEDGISAYFWGSQIRGVSYLNRVRAARDRVRREIRS